jgi:hypothetical protein
MKGKLKVKAKEVRAKRRKINAKRITSLRRKYRQRGKIQLGGGGGAGMVFGQIKSPDSVCKWFSIGRLMSKLLHPGNSWKLLKKEAMRLFLLWYSSLGEQAGDEVTLRTF